MSYNDEIPNQYRRFNDNEFIPSNFINRSMASSGRNFGNNIGASSLEESLPSSMLEDYNSVSFNQQYFTNAEKQMVLHRRVQSSMGNSMGSLNLGINSANSGGRETNRFNSARPNNANYEPRSNFGLSGRQAIPPLINEPSNFESTQSRFSQFRNSKTGSIQSRLKQGVKQLTKKTKRGHKKKKSVDQGAKTKKNATSTTSEPKGIESIPVGDVIIYTIDDLTENDELPPLPVEAYQCFVCDLKNFSSKEEYCNHIRNNESHKAIREAYDAKYEAQLKYYEKCSKLSVLKRIAHTELTTGVRRVAKKVNTPEKNTVRQFRKYRKCCYTRFESREAYVTHQMSFSHLRQVHSQKLKGKSKADVKESFISTDDIITTSKITELINSSNVKQAKIKNNQYSPPPYDPSVMFGLWMVDVVERFYCTACRCIIGVPAFEQHMQSEDHFNRVVKCIKDELIKKKAEERKIKFEEEGVKFENDEDKTMEVDLSTEESRAVNSSDELGQTEEPNDAESTDIKNEEEEDENT